MKRNLLKRSSKSTANMSKCSHRQTSTILKYGCYVALTTSILGVTLGFVACNGDVEVPNMSVSYGPEVGFADGSVDLTGEKPNINISDIKAEVGMNIDYLSGVTIENEADFPDLEIWVDASLVDIFTPGSYTATYTFKYGDSSVSKDITVTMIENEQSASDVVADSSVSNNSTNNNANSSNNNTSTTNNTTNKNDGTVETTKKENDGTTKATSSIPSNSETTNNTPVTTTKDNSTVTTTKKDPTVATTKRPSKPK